VSDIDFRRIVAILRLAVPYTASSCPRASRRTSGARPSPRVSQNLAGSRTNPGATPTASARSEPVLPRRSPAPRRGHPRRAVSGTSRLSARPATGSGGQAGFHGPRQARRDQDHCDPNALATFVEYLIDYGRRNPSGGEQLVEHALGSMEPATRQMATAMVARVRAGRRDVFC